MPVKLDYVMAHVWPLFYKSNLTGSKGLPKVDMSQNQFEIF